MLTKPRTTGLDRSGWRSRWVGEKEVDAGAATHMGRDLLTYPAWQRRDTRDARRALKGQRRTSDAGRFVMPMMQIDAAPLGVRYRAGFVFGKREHGTRQARLADERQHNRDKPQIPQRRSSAHTRDLHQA